MSQEEQKPHTSLLLERARLMANLKFISANVFRLACELGCHCGGVIVEHTALFDDYNALQKLFRYGD